MGHRHRAREQSCQRHRDRAVPPQEALRTAERIHASTVAHWRTLIDDPDHPGQRVELHAFEQRQRAQAHRLELGRVPSEPWSHVPSWVR